MKKIVVLLVVLLGCMPVTAFAQKQFFFKDGNEQHEESNCKIR